MTPLSFFDCNAVVGRAASPAFGSWLSAEGLIAEMDRFGIDEALVAHSYGQELDGEEGNRATSLAVSNAPRLHALATVFPGFGGGAAMRVAEELDALLGADFVAVRLHPNPTHHIMDDAVYGRQYALTMVGPILEALESRRMPLFVELAQTSWAELDDVCRSHPELPVVVTHVSYPTKRSLFAVLDARTNLFCDTSCFHAYRGIEEVCGLFGPGRLLFGTRSPVYSALPAKALVLYADIDESQKAAIAGGTLRGLVGSAARPTGAGEES